MRSLLIIQVLSLITLAARAQDTELPPPVAVPEVAHRPLLGTIDGDFYVAPSGIFKVPIPVLPALGGTITDTENVVTFQDTFTTHLTIAAFPQDATQRWHLSVLGTKDYLQYFLNTFILPDFAHAFPKLTLDTKGIFTKNFDGALIVYILLPGGSMFANRYPRLVDDTTPPIAKRGNMLFVKNGAIFVLSTELAERVTEGASYKQTAAQENAVLKERLIDIASRIRFLQPAKP